MSTYVLKEQKNKNFIVINKTKEIKLLKISVYDENTENYNEILENIHFMKG